MQNGKSDTRHSKALVSTDDDKLLVTVDAVIGDLVKNTISIHSVVTPVDGWRSEILEDGDVLAILDATSATQAGKDIDRISKLTENPRIVLVARCGTDALEPLAKRVSAIVPIDTLEELLPCVARLVMAGMSVVPGPVLRFAENDVCQEDRNDPDMERLRSLSYTESRVLLALTEGLSNKHIAKEIEISDNTVRVHVRNIFLKLGVQNRTQAALLATRYRYSGILLEKVEPMRAGRRF